MKVRIAKCRPKNHKLPILAWLIMIFQKMAPWNKRSYSHMAIGYIDTFGRMTYTDASSKTVRSRYDEMFLKQYLIVDWIEININTRNSEFDFWNRKQLGTKYDTSQVIGLLLRILGFMCFNKLGKNFKRMTCNELIIKALVEFNGLKIGDPDHYDLIQTWEIAKRYEV